MLVFFLLSSLCSALAVLAAPLQQRASGTFLAKAPRWVVYSDSYTGASNGGPPAASSLKGFNVFILSFLLASGPADNAQNWARLSSSERSSIVQDYHNHGISLMVSAFGSTESPTTDGNDPVQTAHTMAAWVKKYGLDGIDVDYEDFKAMNAGNGKAENWLVTFTQTLRADLPAGQYIVSHAPVAPWFTDSTSQYPHGAYKSVNSRAGSDIDWYNVQFYNQDDYASCSSLLTSSSSGGFPHTSALQINSHGGVDMNKIVIGKPAGPSDAANGFMSASALASCLAEAKATGWSGGAMFWEFPTANSALITAVRSKSWPVGGSNEPVPQESSSKTPSKTASTESPESTPADSGKSNASCQGADAWSSSATYWESNTVSYNGHVYTAKWWSQNVAPDSIADHWSSPWEQGAAC